MMAIVDHFEIENGFCTDAAQLFCITDSGNTDHQRRDDNWHHDHFDQMNKDIARRESKFAISHCGRRCDNGDSYSAGYQHKGQQDLRAKG